VGERKVYENDSTRQAKKCCSDDDKARGYPVHTAFAASVQLLEPNTCSFLATGASQPSIAEVSGNKELVTNTVTLEVIQQRARILRMRSHRK
jgi:hypothetical protein